MKDKRLLVFAALTLLTYLIGYHAFILHRNIFTWIQYIHYITPAHIILFTLVALAAAMYLGKIRVPVERRPLLLAGLAVLMAVPFWNLPQFNPDSAQYYATARYLQETGFTGLSTLKEAGYEDLPGYPLLLSLVYRIHEGYVSTQLLHILLYALIPLLVYGIGKNLWDIDTGYYAGLLALATPLIHSNHWFLLQDLPLTAFTLLSIYATLKAFDDTRWLAIAVPAAAFTVTLKVTGLLYLGATLPVIVILKMLERYDRRNVVKAAGAAAILFVVLTAIALSTTQLGDRVMEKAKVVGLENNLRRFTGIGNNHPTFGLPYDIGFPQTLLFLAFIPLSLKKWDRRHWLLYLWLIIPFMVAHDTKTRYLMPLFPAISLAAAQAVKRVGDKKMVYFTAAVIALPTLFAVPAISNDYEIRNLQELALETNGMDVSTVGVYAYHIPRYIFNQHELASMTDYYTHKNVVFLGGYPLYEEGAYRNFMGWAYGSNRKYQGILGTLYPNLNLNGEHLLDNYTYVGESSGGAYHMRNTYYARLYRLREGMSGPVDALLYLSNVEAWQPEINKTSFCSSYAVNFYCMEYADWKKKTFSQTYRIGPIAFASTYGKDIGSWLGENMLYMKPPDVGQVNSTYRLTIPGDTVLRFSVSLHPETWHPMKGDGVEFTVLADSETIYQKYVDPKNNPGDRRLHEEEVDVTRYWNRTVDLVFMTRSGPSNDSRYDTAGWGNPRLVE